MRAGLVLDLPAVGGPVTARNNHIPNKEKEV